jgi:hypothetical protein
MPIVMDQIKYCESESQISYYHASDADWWKQPEPIKYPEQPSRKTEETQSSLEREFEKLATRWERESSIHSSPGEKFLLQDYIRIIGKGEQIVPLILKRLKTSKKDWLFALENIVPEEENPAKGIENFKDAVKAWIEWGDNKYHRSNEVS